MKTQIKTTLLCAAMLCIAVYMTACTKSSTTAPPSIVGTWGVTSGREQIVVGSVAIVDTTVQFSAGQLVFTFTADGSYTGSSAGTITNGAYTLVGNTLSLVTAGSSIGWQRYTITLTANTLNLPDTLAHQGDTTQILIFNFTR